MTTDDVMIECPKCGMFSDPDRRTVCWKCHTPLPPPALPLEPEP